MLRATGSPQRPTAPRSSDIAQRLHEAAAIDSQYSELEKARIELERARQRKPPPPPPPASPRSRSLNRVLEIVSADLRASGELSQEAAEVALRSVKSAISQVLTEHDVYQESEDGSPVRSPPENEYALESTARRRLPFESETRLAVRQLVDPKYLQLAAPRVPPQPFSGRLWNTMITSASLQFNKAVEYELRSELTVVTENPADVITGTCVVRRRYRDFDRLRKMLLAEKGPDHFVLIPNLPPKNAKSIVTGSRADPQFVWERRVALFFWLRYMCEHHVIRNSTLVRVFLWEPSRASMSKPVLTAVEDLSPGGDKALCEKAIAHQQKVMEYRFGNSVVALTSMATHIRMMTQAYQRASTKAKSLVACDQSLGRSLSRACRAFSAWADFEKSAGQNYSFASRFADALPARDANRPNFTSAAGASSNAPTSSSTSADGTVPGANDVEALVSFAEKHSSLQLQMVASKDLTSSEMDKILVKDHVEVPETVGAFCDVRSVNAFQTLLSMWGDDIFPQMEGNLVDPKRASAYYEETKSKSDLFGNRMACEWAELENLKREMMRDGAIHLVLDQVRHAQAEKRRWMQLQEVLRVQEMEISSLAALGDHVSESPMVSPEPQLVSNVNGISSSSSSARSSPVGHGPSRPSSQTGSTPPAISASKIFSGVHELEEDLDEVQARFQEHEGAKLLGKDDRTLSAKFHQLEEEDRYLNPFFSDEDD